ncbi:putative lipoprotein transmembrane [Candidatus Burkholderia pumila]|uniref:Lipoprotein transmembrane n=1 Tax=Candidatus Burkholderia pumila TaxID=1090375 RepID=A0ABR5HJK5_9BURK|nr:putative lipoprotein transmembrane [Candidatus Burkholderia pumila]
MESTFALRRLLRLVGRLAVCASLTCAVTAFADTLDERNELIHHFVTDFNANPLAADCAAHGSFVASTSTAFDHVEVLPASFDSSHFTIEPWNDSFDDKKQRIKVDNVVTVEGQGGPKNADRDPTPLKFRCGYVGSQMLAFGWNDPVPPLRPQSHSTSRSMKSKHGAKTKSSGSKTKSTAKSSGKSSSSTAKKSTSKKKH